MIIVGVDYHPSEPLGVKHFLFGSCGLGLVLWWQPWNRNSEIRRFHAPCS